LKNVALLGSHTCEISSAFSKLDFVAFQQQFNFIYYSTLNWLVQYPRKVWKHGGVFSAFNRASYGLTCPQYFCDNSR
jgi:hypothetical protein